MENKNDNLLLNSCIILEWDFERNKIQPDKLSVGSGRKVWWICSKNKEHKWEAKISHRKKSGCPYCAGKKADENNNFSLLFPDLLNEWDFEKNKVYPNEVTSQTHKKVWWICSKNKEHKWEAKISNRTANNTKCPYCCNQKKDKFNCLSATHPHLLEEWDYEKNKIKPEEVSRGTKKKVWWICSKNKEHKWKANIKNRAVRSSRCPMCSTVISKGHREVADFVSSIYSGKIVLNDRETIYNKETKSYREIDIFFPEIKFAIEYNGNFYHSSYFGKDYKVRDKEKQILCEQSEIKLFTVWEEEWKAKQEEIKQKIKSFINFYLLVL